MNSSLRTLLDGVFDYAGLFPPAKLGMREAVEQFERHRRGPEAWMVSRYVCSSARLPEFVETLAEMPELPEIPLSVVGRAASTYDEWENALEKDAQDMSGLVLAAGNRASIEGYEIRVPSHDCVDACLRDLRAFSQVDVFAELPWGDGMDDSLAQIAVTETIFAKARTGGPDWASIPSADALAGFIHAAVSLELPFKLTAGLHHPYPTLDLATGGRMHGFLNALIATAVATEQDLSRAELAQMLSADQVGLIYLEEIWMAEQARDLFVGIGSCSIDEPVADLTALGLYS